MLNLNRADIYENKLGQLGHIYLDIHIHTSIVKRFVKRVIKLYESS